MADVETAATFGMKIFARSMLSTKRWLLKEFQRRGLIQCVTSISQMFWSFGILGQSFRMGTMQACTIARALRAIQVSVLGIIVFRRYACGCLAILILEAFSKLRICFMEA